MRKLTSPSVRLVLLVVASLIASTSAAPAPASGVEFVITHNNDMHSRFEQTGKYSNACTEEEARANKCFGGFARVSTVLKKFRYEAQNGGPPVLYLNAGDTYTGTPWFTLFKDKIAADFLNILKPDAIVSGNRAHNMMFPIGHHVAPQTMARGQCFHLVCDGMLIRFILFCSCFSVSGQS